LQKKKVQTIPQDEVKEVADIFQSYGLSQKECQPILDALRRKPKACTDRWSTGIRSSHVVQAVGIRQVKHDGGGPDESLFAGVGVGKVAPVCVCIHAVNGTSIKRRLHPHFVDVQRTAQRGSPEKNPREVTNCYLAETTNCAASSPHMP